MSRSRFSEKRIVRMLNEHEAGRPTVELYRRYGVSKATFYRWRARYGGMRLSDAREMKTLEAENAMLKTRLEEQMREVTALREALKKLAGTGARRKAVQWAITEKGCSQRRACALVGMDPKTCRYVQKRPDDTALRARLKALAAQRRRFGYRRLQILLSREGMVVNHKKLYRIYKEEGLTIRRRGGRKRALGARADAPAAGLQPAMVGGLRPRRPGRRQTVSSVRSRR